MREPTVLLGGLGIPESPRWHEGRLWFCNWIDQQVVAVGLDGTRETRAPSVAPPASRCGPPNAISATSPTCRIVGPGESLTASPLATATTSPSGLRATRRAEPRRSSVRARTSPSALALAMVFPSAL